MDNEEPLGTLLADQSASFKRSLPWRQLELDGTIEPYKILVSEFMLQQTQVNRVIPKYLAFTEQFPTLSSLAAAPLAAVLTAWNGLGYNRRAKYLWEAAQGLQAIKTPWTEVILVSYKGIGHNTAAAILAYSYDAPVVFVETNIRTVLIYHFYPNEQTVTDKQLLQTLTKLVPWNRNLPQRPREFYWALMDYGTFLKTTIGNKSRQSSHYKKQPTFAGSRRQLRGLVITTLTKGPLELQQLRKQLNDARLTKVINDLEKEQLINISDTMIMLYNNKNS
jgi:A/G-specific adenine glycosylase